MSPLLLFLTLSVTSEPTWMPDWTDNGINELLLRTNDKPVVFLGIRPLGYKEFKRFLSDTNVNDSFGAYIQEHLTSIIENSDGWEYNAGVITDSLTHGSFIIGKQFKKSFFDVCIEPIIKVGNSNGYPDSIWQKIIAADYLKGYIECSIFNFSLLAGREPIKWGVSPRDELLISGDAPPFDMLQASYWGRKYKFSYFVTQLEAQKEAGIGDINRYLSGHRIEYALTNSFYLGASEVALFGGAGRFPDPYYLNPIFIYYPDQWNRESQVNILWSFDSKLIFKKTELFAELLIDDYPYQKDTLNDHPKLGLDCGLQNAFSRFYWLFEYKGVTRWTYDHLVPWQRYTYLGYPIGNPNGPDFDEFFLGLNYHAGKNIDLVLDGDLVRKGEGTINETYPDKFPDSYWLTGNLKNNYNIELGIKWYRFPGLVITCKSGCIIDGNKAVPGGSFFISKPGSLIL